MSGYDTKFPFYNILEIRSKYRRGHKNSKRFNF